MNLAEPMGKETRLKSCWQTPCLQAVFLRTAQASGPGVWHCLMEAFPVFQDKTLSVRFVCFQVVLKLMCEAVCGCVEQTGIFSQHKSAWGGCTILGCRSCLEGNRRVNSSDTFPPLVADLSPHVSTEPRPPWKNAPHKALLNTYIYVCKPMTDVWFQVQNGL